MSSVIITTAQVLLLLGVFCELQKVIENGAITVEQLLQISRHYRAVIHICVMELQEENTGVAQTFAMHADCSEQ